MEPCVTAGTLIRAGWLADNTGYSCITTTDLTNRNSARGLVVIRQGTFTSPCPFQGGGSSIRAMWVQYLDDPSHIEYTYHDADYYRRIGTTNNDDTAPRALEIYLL